MRSIYEKQATVITPTVLNTRGLQIHQMPRCDYCQKQLSWGDRTDPNFTTGYCTEHQGKESRLTVTRQGIKFIRTWGGLKPKGMFSADDYWRVYS